MRTNAIFPSVVAVFVLLPALGATQSQRALAQSKRADSAQRPSPALQIAAPAQKSGDDACASGLPQSEHAYSGWQNCHFCHRGGAPTKGNDNEQSNILVTLSESEIWLKNDKHAIAAKVLCPDDKQQNLAYRMQQALGPDRYQDLVQTSCQNCHAAGEPAAVANAKDQCGVKLEQTFGVTCEACHGPAKDWIHTHWEERKTWRYKPPAEKAKKGFVNLRDPATKARKCLSCHLGDVAEGKLVTHEMYAAGHPPLPGFDVGTFASAMPVHWTGVQEKGDVRYKSIHHAERINAPNTRELLLSGLAALESNLKLVSDYAASTEANGGWPEFALYDCFACHHDLQSPSRRPLPGAALGRPGRPSLRAWPNVIAEIALAEIEPRPPVDRLVSDVANVLGEQPFGRRDRLQPAATTAATLVCQQIDRLKAQLDRSTLTDDEARKLDRQLVERILNRIGDLATRETHDYDSARQLLWAYERVYADYKKLDPQSPQHRDVESALDKLKTPWGFDITKGQERIGEQNVFSTRLAARSLYDPRKFAEAFIALKKPPRGAVQNP